MNSKNKIDYISKWIKEYANSLTFQSASLVIGVSGGIESALVSAIAVSTLGSKNVLGLALPTKYNSNKSLDLAKELSKNLTVPPNLNSLVEREEIGILMLKLVEIIGSDEVKNLDPETLYFIVNLLNKAKIKKIRNEILNLTLPLRV